MYKFCFLIRMVSEESIQKLLANLKKQSNIDFEQDVQLIVVDVVSTRETEYIQKLKEHVNVTYLACPDGLRPHVMRRGILIVRQNMLRSYKVTAFMRKRILFFRLNSVFL